MELLATLFTLLTGALGVGFFTAGTIGLLRFGDLRSRVHALAKADTVGLGFTLVALLPWLDSVWSGLKLVLIWLLALAAASVSAHLLTSEVADDAT